MKLGRVIGQVWAVNKVHQLKSCRLFVVQPVHSDGHQSGHPLVAADPQNMAGVGDRVVYVTNTDAAQAFDTGTAPVNAAIVELVDFVD
ncbi:EutN/CcmL family microcompartment protein [bacterium]|nr:EutN/CcmL family microcompartment protein [bacterium]